MTKKKKIIIAVVSAAVVVAIVLGLIFILPALDQKVVDVYPVERVREYSWGDQLGSYGNIMAANVQNVYLDTELLLDSIEVEEGQEVKAGDTLLCYDMTIQNLELNTIRINIDILQNKIKKSEQELNEAKGLVASSPLPPPPAPKDPVSIVTTDPMTAPLSGTGSASDPFIFNCMEGTTITEPYLRQKMKADYDTNLPSTDYRYYEFRIYYGNNVLMYKWTIDASTLNPAHPDYNTLFADGWNLSDGASSGEAIDVSAAAEKYKNFGTIKKLADTVNYDPNVHYSQSEIDRMVNNAENEIATLTTELKQERLKLEEAEAEYGDGTVVALIDGIVSSVGDPDNLEQGAALITVQSESGYRVEGSVSELNRDKIAVGDEVTVSSWQTGGSYTAVIKEIMAFPAQYYSGSMGNENPLNTYYTFVATINTDEVLLVGDWVEISFTGGGTAGEPSDALYLPNALIREEDGRSYVMIADEDGRLKKQFVQTGKSNYGWSTEIKAGLTLADNIAFPYGKNAKEGALTQVAEGYFY